MDRPAKEDGQRLREAACERGGVRICCHDSPHDEASRPCLRTFHTVSEGEFSEVRWARVIAPSVGPLPLPPGRWVAVGRLRLSTPRLSPAAPPQRAPSEGWPGRRWSSRRPDRRRTSKRARTPTALPTTLVGSRSAIPPPPRARCPRTEPAPTPQRSPSAP